MKDYIIADFINDKLKLLWRSILKALLNDMITILVFNQFNNIILNLIKNLILDFFVSLTQLAFTLTLYLPQVLSARLCIRTYSGKAQRYYHT